ncbi:5-hydroxytryptamine receptor 3A-like [Brevipalpus obovatus]|uniref:5-hydroxytryptamine receptor 3A-like n=1 Tax=Brevipalpus obovatus TaxID=246614 RepID=UPI003D9DED62
MMSRIVNFSYILLVIFVNYELSSCKDERPTLKKLRDDVLANYDREFRPVKNHNSTVNVTLSILIYSIERVSVTTQTFGLDAFFIMQWKDEYLVWDKTKYDNIDMIKLEAHEIWMPDLYNSNMAPEAHETLGGESLMIHVNSSGDVLAVFASTLVVGCVFNLKDYPFDQHTCTLVFTSYSYWFDELQFLPSSGGYSYGPFFDNPEWEVTKIREKDEPFQAFWNKKVRSFLKVFITIKRRTDMHEYCIFLPYLAASILGLAMFTIPVGHNVRLVFGGISLFILMNLLVIIGYEVGFHSIGVPYAIRCISINMVILIVSIIISNITYQIIINSMFTCPPLPSVLANFLSNPWIGKLFCLSAPSGPTLVDEELGEEEDSQRFNQAPSKASSREYVLLIKLVDRCLFVFYVVLLIFYHS